MKTGRGLLFFEATAFFWIFGFHLMPCLGVSGADATVGILLCTLVAGVVWVMNGCLVTRDTVEYSCFVLAIGALVCGLMLFLINWAHVASLRASITLYAMSFFASAYAAKHYQKTSVKMMLFFVLFMPVAGLGAIKISFAMLLITTTAYFIPAIIAVECAQDASLYNLFKCGLTLKEMVRVAACGVLVGVACTNCGAAVLPMHVGAAKWATILLSAIVSAIAARYYYIERECSEEK